MIIVNLIKKNYLMLCVRYPLKLLRLS